MLALYHFFYVAQHYAGAVYARFIKIISVCLTHFLNTAIYGLKYFTGSVLDVAAQLKRSAHAALGLAIKCAH